MRASASRYFVSAKLMRAPSTDLTPITAGMITRLSIAARKTNRRAWMAKIHESRSESTSGKSKVRHRQPQRDEEALPRGHEYTAENTYINATSGSRVCRACRKSRR